MRYFITWEIDIEADTPMEAAKQAFAIHRNPDSIASIFDVIDNATGQNFRIDVLEDTVELK